MGKAARGLTDLRRRTLVPAARPSRDRVLTERTAQAGFVDTHLHLEELDDVDAAVEDATSAGVTTLITMGTDAETNAWAVAASNRMPQVYAAIGHHPTSRAAPDIALLERASQSGRVVAIGEIGLDEAHPQRPPLAQQKRWLHSLCELAVARSLPVSVHMRDTALDVERVLSEHRGLTGVMHYFSLDWDWARRFLRLGFYLSFSGLITRPSRMELREVVKRCPADRFVLETDSPFGTPHNRNRESNRPAWLVDTAEVVAKLRDLTVADVARIERQNATALFGRLNSPDR